MSNNISVEINKDGKWEVSMFHSPYPPDATPLAITLYEDLKSRSDAHIRQLTGKLLTFIDSFGDSEQINKARKDITRQILDEHLGNVLVDTAALCEDLDDWCRWVKSNHPEYDSATTCGSTLQDSDWNAFKKVENL